MGIKKKGMSRRCSECRKRAAKQRVLKIIGRFETKYVYVCDSCAKKVYSHNAEFAN